MKWNSLGRNVFRKFGNRCLSSTTNGPAKGQKLYDFLVRDVVKVDELDLVLVKLTHEPTNAAHFHVIRDDPNNVFCVAFKTPPQDSTGVPHILEHVTLCGSNKYPVRDPFFKMLNRSLASYMNAWTASEHTAYPFCTANHQDYAHLRDVYCDAVFNPNLSEFDFLQEGWRLEHENPNDKSSPITFKGVVYNEMKGAFSDVESLFAQRLQQSLFKDSIYEHVSGGDPPYITNLTHEQLKGFHRKHYNPSNALFYTYGDYPLESNLKYLSEKLQPYTKSESVSVSVPDSISWPRTIEAKCPLDPRTIQTICRSYVFILLVGNPEKQLKVSVSYLMNDIEKSPQETFNLKILSHLLLDGSSAPLYKALIDSNIGQNYSAGTGYDCSTKQATFSVGLQGISENDVNKVLNIVTEVLQECKKNGFSQERIDTVLHLLELGTKYRSSQYGLALSHRIISSWVYDIDPEVDLAVNKSIESFKKEYEKGGLFESLIDKYFLNNSKKLAFIMRPDDSYNENLIKEESDRLRKLTDGLSEQDKALIFERNQKLQQLQEHKEDLSSLPCLKSTDLQKQVKTVEFSNYHHDGHPKMWVRQTTSTNGISFFKTIIPISNITEEDLKLLPLLCQSLTELGIEEVEIETFDQKVKMYTGGLQSSLFVGRHPWGLNDLPEISLSIGSYSLDRNVENTLNLLADALSKTDFNNLGKLKSIISSNASSLSNSIASSGHMFAMTKAASGLSIKGHLDEISSGLYQSEVLNKLAEQEDLGELSLKLKSLARKIFSSAPNGWRTAFVTQDSSLVARMDEFHRKLSYNQHNSEGSLNVELNAPSSFIKMPFATSYAAKVYQFNPYNLKQSAHLAILAKLLRSGFLHKEIREKGGAYGGGASYSTLNGQFSFYSYRDPNPTNSHQVFDRAPGWMLDQKITEQDLLEARLSVFSSLDAPVDVSAEGLHTFYHGITDVDRQLFRDQLLAAKAQDIKETVSKLFTDKQRSSSCTIGPS